MIIDGRKIADKIYKELSEKISQLKEKPVLATILVGDNRASEIYVNQKKKFAELVGMGFILKKFDDDISQEELLNIIKDMNEDKSISGFIVQLPLPSHINTQKIIDSIDSKKDVDGFTKENVGKLFYGDHSGLESCTPKGIKRLLDEYDIHLKGKNVTIIGKSNIVGKPLSLLFINNSATVTVCDIYTPNLKEHTLKSDIIVCAVGKVGIITKDMVNPGSTIIDVGINKIDGKIYGDCDFDNLEKDNQITPVPGGVGPMTVAMLIENTYLAHIN